MTPAARPLPGASARPSWHETARVLAVDGTFAIRCGLFLLGLGTAVRLLLPGQSIASSPGYAWFAARGPDGYWACWAAFEAALHLWAMVRRDVGVRTWTAFVGACLRCCVVYGLFQSNAQTLGVVTHALPAYLALFLTFRNAAGVAGDAPSGNTRSHA